MIIWKKKSKIQRLNQFVDNFSLCIKQCYHIIWIVEKIQLMSRKHKKVCATLNHIKHFLILASAITACISISGFASLLDITIGITSSAVGLKICAIVSGKKV